MNSPPPISLSDYPRAIIHMDADAFFASVEQALVPALQGRPVVTGKERGIIACANYEAKARGIKRGVPLFKAKRLCPELVILPNDYETYSLYSKRMFNILRTFTPIVEEYSVDEAFADITGLRRTYHASYEDIARRIQDTVVRELGITVSIGLSPSKALAKICSKFRKPNGITAVPGKYIHHLLQRTSLETVWGFGPNTVSLLQKYGMKSAYDFVCKPEHWARRMLHKPGLELWNELRGHSVWPVTPEEKSAYATILKSKTFTPPSEDHDLVYAKLIRNVESAFMKARRYRLRPKSIGVVLRHHDFRHDGLEARLNRPSSSTVEIIPLIQHLFEKTFRPGSRYRSTMVVLGGLESDLSEQYELFEDRLSIEGLRRITQAVDSVNHKFGKHTVCAGTALFLPSKPKVARDDIPTRRQESFKGETPRQRLAIPRLSITV
ncbi:MAG: DNA polymerase IV [Verrucomicrobia bacterium]|nr:DNA polymerase IV [Verrucomicrobiota bacterium]